MNGTVAAISSFPRSGTHFLIDLMRLNFQEFSWQAPPWKSAQSLYYNLDRFAPEGVRWSTEATQRDNFIVKTHQLAFKPELSNHLRYVTGTRQLHLMTPFRHLSKQLSSYLSFIGSEISVAQLLETPDPFFRNGKSVKDCLLAFYGHALDNSFVIDVAAGRERPEELLDEIAQRFALRRLPTPARLPERRSGHRLLGEIKSRLTGRKSTEVVVNKSANTIAVIKPSDISDPQIRALDEKLRSAAWH